jgi:hypothetical protein
MTVRIFLQQSDEWRAADNAIGGKRSALTQQPLPGTDDLRAAAPHEIACQEAMWEHNYAAALEHARQVLTVLMCDEVKPYRALAWSHCRAAACSLVSLTIADLWLSPSSLRRAAAR